MTERIEAEKKLADAILLERARAVLQRRFGGLLLTDPLWHAMAEVLRSAAYQLRSEVRGELPQPAIGPDSGPYDRLARVPADLDQATQRRDQALREPPPAQPAVGPAD